LGILGKMVFMSTLETNMPKRLYILWRTLSNGPIIKETLFSSLSGFYITRIDCLTTMGQIKSAHALWHERFGHPRSTMLAWIIKDLQGLPTNLRNVRASTPCMACSCGKLIAQPFTSKNFQQISHHSYQSFMQMYAVL
jgi:hypothetical protein